jgi:hypothetical protein
LIAGELAARFILGLGDPPLYVLDPEIEYLLAPNQCCRRFGNDYIVNKWSMRSGPLAEPKPASELRVLVIGDSIVNGGGRIDQSRLATTRLCQELDPAQGGYERRVAANISAGSWGPPNELAYVKRFGTFDADVVIIVLNSDDVADVPGLEYIGSSWPRRKPWCALQELVGVYAWRGVCKVLRRSPEPAPAPHAATHEQDVEACHRAFDELVTEVRRKGAKVGVVQYLKRPEVTGRPEAGYTEIGRWAAEAGIEPVSSGPAFKVELDAGHELYLSGEDVHPNDQGQAILAGVLREAIDRALAGKPGTPAGR